MSIILPSLTQLINCNKKNRSAEHNNFQLPSNRFYRSRRSTFEKGSYVRREKANIRPRPRNWQPRIQIQDFPRKTNWMANCIGELNWQTVLVQHSSQ